MTLEEGTALLSENAIPFALHEFENEGAFWKHQNPSIPTKHAKPCKVKVLILRSKNGKRDLALQFNAEDGTFRFCDLYFGDYSYEMFDYAKEFLEEELLHNIQKVRQGTVMVITTHGGRTMRWLGDEIFDLNEDDEYGTNDEFQERIRRIKQPKRFLEKLFGIRRKYEIYNWNSYECVIK